jgi:predicted permease
MLGEPSGFQPDHAIAMRVLLGDDRYKEEGPQIAFLDELERRLAGYPGLVAAGVGTELPLEGSDTNGSVEVVGKPPPPGVEYECKKRMVGPGYFDALGVRVLRGRAFRASDRAGAPDVAIISDAFRRQHFGDEDPLGRRVKFLWGPGEDQEVVGVVDDVRHDGLDRPAACIIYRPMAQFPRRGFNLVVRATGDPLALAEGLRRVLSTIDSSVATHGARTLEQIVERSTAQRRTLIVLLSGFALLALCLASVGVYGVVSLAAGQRTREIGLRMAIGAQPSDVVRLILREATPTIAVGLLCGLGLTLAIGKLVAGMLYGVSAMDPLTLGVVALLLGGIGVVAALVPALRAARMSPVDALRLL